MTLSANQSNTAHIKLCQKTTKVRQNVETNINA